MSVLDVLAKTAGVVGAGYGGYGDDQQMKVKEVLEKAKEAREAESAAVLNALHRREAGQLRLGDPNYAGAMGQVAGAEASAKIPAAVEEARQLSPITTETAVNTAKGVEPIHTEGAISTARGVAPINVATHDAEHQFDVSHPETSYTFTPGTDPATGQPTLFRGSTHGGELVSTGVGKPVGTGGGAMSGQTLMAMQRLGFTKNDLQQSLQQMEDFENNPENLKKLTTLNKVLSTAAGVQPSQDAHGFTGAINNALGSAVSGAAQTKIATDFPELAQYLYNRQRVGTAFTEVLPRPNQQLLGIERGLSGVESGWTPGVIKDVQARRRTGYDMLTKLLESTPLGSGGTTNSVPTKRSASDILAAHGIH